MICKHENKVWKSHKSYCINCSEVLEEKDINKKGYNEESHGEHICRHKTTYKYGHLVYCVDCHIKVKYNQLLGDENGTNI